ncbi:MAG: hypothetical protein N3D11_06250, partial [Candidatus Sumerlaeia bacterium]|nr:hypothetical protein [Candidatus Sumerlaeia bacterium]
MNRMHLRMRAIAAGLCAVLLAATPTEKKPRDPAQWEKDIRAFEEKDKAAPPAKQGILFIGSSSIRRWDLDKWFPNLGALNRGFGGSHISDSVAFTSRIVLPYQPRVIVFYSGDNDLQYGKSPETVCEDFKAFVRAVHSRLPHTRIVFI